MPIGPASPAHWSGDLNQIWPPVVPGMMELERRIKRHWASDGSADHHNFQDLEEASKDPSNFMTVHPHRRAHLLYSLAPTAPLTSETFSRPAFPSPSGRCCWSIRDTALLGYWVTPYPACLGGSIMACASFTIYALQCPAAMDDCV